MNSSELSTVQSDGSVFTTPRSNVYLATRDGSQTFYESERGDIETAEIDYAQELAAGEAISSHTDELPSSYKQQRIDLGLWLLSSLDIRQAKWNNLRLESQSSIKSSAVRFSRFWHFIKRSCDVAGSLLLLIGFSPLFLVIAITIKLDSRGPVFFHHSRAGKDGRLFSLWKFRSMKIDVPRYETSPQSSTDHRLTRVGRFIRRMSIDELPQLINVLNGEMSLVGPRPEMPFIVDRYCPIERERLAAVPGITGLWQISPARAFPIHENIGYDLHYIRNQNFFLDCAILIRTVTAVIHGIGAV
jgi:lipopolysaccharide/colanic/teichoic acid biosynthesis glycosyltransferase